MKGRILGAMLGAAALAGVFAMAGAPAEADHSPPPREVPQEEGCYEEYTQYHFAKFTHERTREWVPGEEGTEEIPSKWWVWAPDNTHGPQDYEPNFPTDDRGKWVGPKTNGGPDQNTFGTFNASHGNSGNSSWFHRNPGVPGVAGTEGYFTEWTAWSEWAKWSPETHTSWEDSPDPLGSPAPHGNWTDTYQREWQARHDGETRVKTREVPCQPIEVEPSVEYTSPDCFAEGTVVLSEGEGYTWTENEDGTYTAVADEGYVIVGDATFGPYETDQLTGRQCQTLPPLPPLPPLPIEAIPVDPSVTDPTCDAPGTVVLPTSPVGYDWVLQPDGSYEAVADPGYYFDLAAVTTFDPGDLSQLDGAVCEAPTSSVASEPPVVPPAVVPPAVDPPAVDPPAVAPPAQATVAQTTQLPSTGSSSWTLVLIALVTLLGGTGLVRLSRRPTD